MPDTETGMLTAASAMEMACSIPRGPISDMKPFARALIEIAIAAYRACARERCANCRENWPIHWQDGEADHWNTNRPYESCHAQFEQREIARLTRELEKLV